MINSYDIDGVINMGELFEGLRPQPNDIIVTGRCLEEKEYTEKWLHDRGINNEVYFSRSHFNLKTRQNSGWHKADTLNKLRNRGVQIGIHFDDDPIQADIIERECKWIRVVRLVHDLVEKENVWHGPTGDSRDIKLKQ